MIDQGATTIWENWEGSTDDGEAIGSLNHYSKGAVVTFLHRYVAGLRPDEDHPGYERFTVAPMPGGGLTHAEAVHDARRGRVRSAWTIADGTFTLEVEVPPGAEADVVLPDGQTTIAGPGTSTHTCPVQLDPPHPADVTSPSLPSPPPLGAPSSSSTRSSARRGEVGDLVAGRRGGRSVKSPL